MQDLSDLRPSLRNYLTRGALARGQVISSASMIERLLDIGLSRYFSNSKESQRELIELIFHTEKMSFKSKYKLLIEIIRRKCLKDGIDFQKHFQGLQKRFDDIALNRNKYAHEAEIVDDLPDEVLNKFTIILVNLSDIAKKSSFITQKKFEKTIEELDNMIDEMTIISEWMFNNGQPPSIKK